MCGTNLITLDGQNYRNINIHVEYLHFLYMAGFHLDVYKFQLVATK
jgi:hypothetical protein